MTATATAAITIPEECNGPARSANGGIAAGLLAKLVPAPATVRLLAPPPLGRPLAVTTTGDGIAAIHDGTAVMTASPGALPGCDPPAVSPEEAAAATQPRADHPAPTCVVCGRSHPRGLRVFPGRLTSGTYACLWTPPDWSGDERGHVRAELVWGVLDCPGGFAVADTDDDQPADFFPALATITCDIRSPVPAGRPVVVIGWQTSAEGRKRRAATAIVSESGDLLAASSQTCVALPREWAAGAGTRGEAPPTPAAAAQLE